MIDARHYDYGILFVCKIRYLKGRAIFIEWLLCESLSRSFNLYLVIFCNSCPKMMIKK